MKLLVAKMSYIVIIVDVTVVYINILFIHAYGVRFLYTLSI